MMLNYTCRIQWMMNHKDERFTQKAAPLIALNSFLAILGIFLNILVFRGLWSIKTIPFGTRVLLLSLCGADLMTGLFLQPAYLTLLTLQLNGTTVCTLALAIDIISVSFRLASFSTVTAATFERYVSIFHPYFHQRITHGWKPKLIVTSIWAFSIICTGLLVESLKEHSLMIWIVWNSLGCCWVMVAYARIYYLAHQLKSQIKRQEKRFHNGKSSDKKSTNIVAGLALLSVACYLPFIVVQCVRYATGNSILKSHEDQYLWTLAVANSALNPAFYCLLNKTVRNGTFQVWKISQN